jgi:hypothetical protein
MPANSARLMVCDGGVEVTKISMRVSEAGWAAAAPRGEEPPFLEPSVYTKSCQFHAGFPLEGEYVGFVRS